MEQSSGKKERVILAAGLAAGLALAAAQYFSPLSGALWRGEDVPVAVLGERSSALLLFKPANGSVSAFTLTHARKRTASDPVARARELSELAGAASKEQFFVVVSSAADLEQLLVPLDKWRSEPRRFFLAAAWAWRLKEAGLTGLSGFDLLSLFTEFTKLASSDFFLSELSRRQTEPEQEEGPVAGPAPRVEVFNASGRKDLAARAAKRLRALGFDVITAASHGRPEERTRILGFSRDASEALALRSALGLEELEIRVRPSKKSVAGAAVILGADFDERNLER